MGSDSDSQSSVSEKSSSSSSSSDSSHHSESHHSESHHSDSEKSSHHSESDKISEKSMSHHDSSSGIHETHEGSTHVEHVGSDDGSDDGAGSFCSSIGCSIVGFILILGCTYGHYKNEQAAVQRSELYIADELSNALYSHVESTAILANTDSGNLNGKLIHYTTPIKIESSSLKDHEISSNKVTAKCYKLERFVHMYQTCERAEHVTETSNGKKKSKTIYHYDDKWSSVYCDHTKFNKQSSKYKNKKFNLESKVIDTSKVSVKSKSSKKIVLSDDFARQINWLNSDESDLQTPIFKDNSLRKSSKESAPRKGDYKIYWKCYGKDNDEVSVLGKVNDKGDELVTYVTSIRVLWSKFETSPLSELKEGTVTLEEMVESLRSTSSMWVWLFRILLFIAIIVGSVMFWGPLSYLLDQIPCCGDFLSGIVDVFAGISGFLWSLFVVVLCWCLVRPWLLLIFGLVLVACIGAIIAFRQMNPKIAKQSKNADGEMEMADVEAE